MLNWSQEDDGQLRAIEAAQTIPTDETAAYEVESIAVQKEKQWYARWDVIC